MPISLVIDTPGGANFAGFNLRNVGRLHVGGSGLPTAGYVGQFTGDLLVKGDLLVEGTTTFVGATTLGVTTLGNTTINGTLGVTGATTLSSTLTVAGNATVGGTLGVTGAATLSSTLGVTGVATFQPSAAGINAAFGYTAARQLQLSTSDGTFAGDTHTLDAVSGGGQIILATTNVERFKVDADGAHVTGALAVTGTSTMIGEVATHNQFRASNPASLNSILSFGFRSADSAWAIRAGGSGPSAGASILIHGLGGERARFSNNGDFSFTGTLTGGIVPAARVSAGTFGEGEFRWNASSSLRIDLAAGVTGNGRLQVTGEDGYIRYNVTLGTGQNPYHRWDQANAERMRLTDRLLVGATTIGSSDAGGIVVQNASEFRGQIISTVADGTPPFNITSTTVVTNLNADFLDGQHASAFALSGHTHAHFTLTNNPHSVTKAQVGLSAVENTALSTWPGSSNLVTAGALVATSLSLGGAVVTNILSATAAWNPGTVNAGFTASVNITVTGAAVGDVVAHNFIHGFDHNFVVVNAYVSSANTVRVVIANWDTVNLTFTSRTVRVTVFKF